MWAWRDPSLPLLTPYSPIPRNSECSKVLQVPKLISVDSRILKVILTIRIRRKLCDFYFFFLSVHVCVKKLCSTVLILYIVLNAYLSLKGSGSTDNRWTLLSACNAKCVLMKLVTLLWHAVVRRWRPSFVKQNFTDGSARFHWRSAKIQSQEIDSIAFQKSSRIKYLGMHLKFWGRKWHAIVE